MVVVMLLPVRLLLEAQDHALVTLAHLLVTLRLWGVERTDSEVTVDPGRWSRASSTSTVSGPTPALQAPTLVAQPLHSQPSRCPWCMVNREPLKPNRTTSRGGN